jgi:hypothetical protein
LPCFGSSVIANSICVQADRIDTAIKKVKWIESSIRSHLAPLGGFDDDDLCGYG